MKKYMFSLLALVALNFYAFGQELSPFIEIGRSSESIEGISNQVERVLKDNGFEILGSYNPAGLSTLKVIAFTNEDLKSTVVKVADRGALAAIFKVGLQKKNGEVIMSYTNPDYILRAYLMDNYDSYESTFSKFSQHLKTIFTPLGTKFIPFGGTVKADKLKNYHYKIMMPYFTDPIKLKEFDSFETGLALIQNNLNTNKANTQLVYTLVYPDKKIAVFGIALDNKEDGEAYFLPKIGESHVAALPYELILQGKQASMLHGKYRIALHWPDLTMGTFMTIMSTPGDIEDALEALCE